MVPAPPACTVVEAMRHDVGLDHPVARAGWCIGDCHLGTVAIGDRLTGVSAGVAAAQISGTTPDLDLAIEKRFVCGQHSQVGRHQSDPSSMNSPAMKWY